MISKKTRRKHLHDGCASLRFYILYKRVLTTHIFDSLILFLIIFLLFWCRFIAASKTYNWLWIYRILNVVGLCAIYKDVGENEWEIDFSSWPNTTACIVWVGRENQYNLMFFSIWTVCKIEVDRTWTSIKICLVCRTVW